MNNIYIFIIFIITFIIYFHIIKQYETSEDLEIYEMDYIDNDNLQETCEIKQPIIFKRGLQNLPDITSCKQTLNVKSGNDYKNTIVIDPIELPCESLVELLHSNTDCHYFTENNSTFIEETKFYKIFTHLDDELKPKITTMSKQYDILMGSKNSYTPLRYHKNSRKFIYVVNGDSIRIKMTPWKFTKYLHEIKDFEHLEYRSAIDVWNNINTMYENDLAKVQFIEFDLPIGSIVHIPNYWWYSIKYKDSNNILLECNYKSFINNISNFFDYSIYFLQNQNIIKNFTRKINVNDNDVDDDEKEPNHQENDDDKRKEEEVVEEEVVEEEEEEEEEEER